MVGSEYKKEKKQILIFAVVKDTKFNSVNQKQNKLQFHERFIVLHCTEML